MRDINLLREALPYIKKFKGKTFVVKFGGEVADSHDRLVSFCEEIALCAQVGIRIVIVHGGGKQATELSRKLGIEAQTINGRRITDEPTLDVVKMVYAGKINVEILGALRKAGVQPVGLSGVDGNLLTARRRPPQTVVDARTGEQKHVDFGFVGDIIEVDSRLVSTLVEQDFIPVIASLAADDDGTIYNVNADTIAAAVAGELRAEKLILATNVDGILGAAGRVENRLGPLQIEALKHDKIITGGMLPKTDAAVKALNSGVRSVHIINGLKPGTLLAELFTEQGEGTMIEPKDE